MRIYRVESKDGGFGPYAAMGMTGDEEAYEVIDRMRWEHNGPAWPNGLQDGMGSVTPFDTATRYGCPSMPAMFSWFGGFLPGLIASGFVVGVYEVPEASCRVGLSGKQVAFDVKHAVRVNREEGW